MNPNEEHFEEKLGARLSAEARANRPVFNAELHARVMAALPSASTKIHWSAPRRSQFNLLRIAALVAVAVGCGVVTISLMKESPASSNLAAAPVLWQSEPSVAVNLEEANRSRRLLALARVRPMKMLNRLLSKPAQKPKQVQEEQLQPKNLENSSVAAADLFSIRVLSRAPFLDMQFKSQPKTHNSVPGN